MVISGIWLIFAVIMALGLIQSDEYTPPSTPPTAPTAAQNTTAGATDQSEFFNNQMYLLDRFAIDIDQPELFVPLQVSANVPPTAPFEKINELININGNAIYNWIHNITPHEYAQLIPKIQLFWVRLDNNSQIPIPLTAPSNLSDEVRNSSYYYTTKAMGLKSLDMEIDGNTNPVTGKIYNITIKLVFDSANTFFEPVAGLGGLRYSDIFRGQGTPGNQNYRGTLKLSLSYDGPPELVAKYDLNGPGQAFSTYLTLINSKLDIKENLLTFVEAKFQGFEEALFKNNVAFDFLRVDITQELEQKRAAMNDARAKHRAASAAQRAASAATIEAARNNISGLEGRLSRQVQRWTGEHRYPDGEISANQKERIDEMNWARRNKIEQFARAVYGPNAVTREAARSGAPIRVTTPDGTFSIGAGTDNPEFRRRMVDAALERYRNPQSSTGERRDFGLPGTGGQRAMQVAASESLKIERAQKEMETKIQALDDELAAKEQGFNTTVASIRMEKLNEALEEAIWLHHESAFRTIKMDNQAFADYTSSLLSNDLKNYFAPGGGQDRQTSRLNPPGETSEPRSETPPEPQSSSVVDINAKRHALNMHMRTLNRMRGQLEQLKLRRHNESNPTVNTPGVREDGFNISTLERHIEGHTEHAQKMRAEIAQAVQEIGPILQSQRQLEQKLNTIRDIEYILLGDLIALIMNRLLIIHAGFGDAGTGNPMALQQIRKTVIILTKIGLNQFPSMNTKNVSLYQMPISVLQLQKIFSDKLQANMKVSFTLFELLSEIIKMVGLAQKRKANLLSMSNRANEYALTFTTYPVHQFGTGPGMLKISTNPDSASKQNGLVISTRSAAVSLAGTDGTYATNKNLRIPHFFFGGYTHGAVKSISIEEKNDDLAKVAMSTLSTGGVTLPAFFESTVKLSGTPFFQIGMKYYMDAPTLNIDRNTETWFLLKGYYTIINLSHSYTAGGQYTTTIVGRIEGRPESPLVVTLGGQEALDEETNSAYEPGQSLISPSAPNEG